MAEAGDDEDGDEEELHGGGSAVREVGAVRD
jgi:hypothetical protein